MASRNERRRKARQRATTKTVERDEASHGDRMMAVVVKAAQTRQPQQADTQLWDPDKVVTPPLPPHALWSIYEQHPVHSGAINAKVADAVGRGWTLKPEDDSEDGAEGDVDRLTRELRDKLKAICTRLSFAQLCQQAVREMDAIGWGAWEVLRDRPGDVTSDIVGILPVPSMHLRAMKTDDNVLILARGEKKVYFKRFGVADQVDCTNGERGDGVPEDDRANELIVFSHYSPRSSWYGIPPWVSAMPPIAELTAIREYNVSWFESGGQADRHIHVSAKDDGVAEELATTIVRQLKTSEGVAHLSLVTHGSDDTEVTTTALQPKGSAADSRDRQFRGGREDLIEEVLVAHQVPPYRVFIAKTGSLGGDTSEQMDEEYRIGVVEPLQEIIHGELERTVFGETGFPIPGFEFKFVGMTRDDAAEAHDQAIDARNAGVLSPNDAREKIGEDRVNDPAMDRYYIAGVPISADDAGVKDAKQLLQELRDALQTAAQAGGKATDEVPEGQDDATADDDVIDQPNATSKTSRRGLWRRRS